MIKIDYIEAFNFQGALRGMRNPLESWAKNDSMFLNQTVHIGDNDLDLAQRLIKGGPVHSKFLRQIFVSMDITAPLYWWKEMDTYKVATVANSTSTMHKIMSKPFTNAMFSLDESFINSYVFAGDGDKTPIENAVKMLNTMREEYFRVEDKIVKEKIWRTIIQYLPDSWEQKRTWTGNYEIMRNINNWRNPHKLVEWPKFCEITNKALPYSKELILYKGENNERNINENN